MNPKSPDETLIAWLDLENELELSNCPIDPPSPPIEQSPTILIPTQTLSDYEKNYSKDFIRENYNDKNSQWPKEERPLVHQNHLLAWYQPMHFYGENWGIYVLQSGLDEIMQSIASYCSQIERKSNPKFSEEIKYAAWALLFLHEEFHHKVEMFGIRSAGLSGSHSYRRYKHQVYSATKVSAPLSCREEAICNAYVFRNISKKLYRKVSPEISSATKVAWIECMKSAVGAYAGSMDLVSDLKYGNAVNHLIDQIVSGVISPNASKLDWRLFPEFFNSLPNLKMNTFIVEDLSSAVNLGNYIQLALPKRKLEKVISRHGYFKTDEGDGSHEKWKKPGSPFIILTKNREQSISVIKSTAKTLGINVDELARETRNL